MADEGSATRSLRSSSRKKKLALTQEEENDGGFKFTRKSKRLKKQNKECENLNDISQEETRVELPVQKSIKKAKSNKKQASSVKQTKRSQCSIKEIQSSNSVEKTSKVESVDVEQEAVLNKNTQKTKSKNRRRSSFIRGRKLHDSLELYESEELANVKGLYKDIPADLTSNERLLLLFEKSLLVMSEKLKRENSQGNTDFVDKGEEFINHLKATLQTSLSGKNNSCDEKNSERIIIPNPKNEQLEKYAKESEEVSKRMTQENKEWEEILQKYQNTSERQVEDINNTVNTVDSLSQDQQEFLKSLSATNDITRNLETVKSKSYLMIDKIYITSEKLKTFSDVTGNYVEDSIKSLGKRAFEGVDGTPRHIIHGALGKKS